MFLPKKFLLVLTLTAIIGFSSCRSGNKTAFVNLNTIYDTFPLKKELSGRLKLVQKIRKDKLDSLYGELEKLDEMQQSGKDVKKQFNALKELFNEKKEQFLNENNNIVQGFDKEIWQKINLEIKDYGEKYGYDFIFGANGSGALMYGNPKNDVTKDVIRFCYDKKEK